MKSLLASLSLVILTSSWAGNQVPPNFFGKKINDSCSLGIKIKDCEVQYCDNGIFRNSSQETCRDFKFSEELNSAQWRSLKVGLQKGSSEKDICQVGFYLGPDEFISCGSKFYKKTSGAKTSQKIKKEEWDTQLKKLFFTENRSSSEDSSQNTH